MPFPVDEQYIAVAEGELNVIFPPIFKTKMMQLNGGEVATEDDDWIVYPFFDRSSTKHMSRTCNHIVLENSNARKWGHFPSNAIVIGDNGCGDYLALLPRNDHPNQLGDEIYVWRHESGDPELVAPDIMKLV
jgi:hypothetical protein